MLITPPPTVSTAVDRYHVTSVTSFAGLSTAGALASCTPCSLAVTN
jgi:hypothetical protein